MLILPPQANKNQYITAALLHDDDALFTHQGDTVGVPVPANIFVLGDRENTARFRQIIVEYFAGVEMDHLDHSILFTIDLKLQNNTEAT
jgi:hypothetical protein